MQQYLVVLSMWLIGISVSATLVYWMTSSAIESSKLAKEVHELKRMMQQLLNEQRDPIYQDTTRSEIARVRYCPLCSAQLYSTSSHCPVCDYPNSNSYRAKGV